MAEANNLWILEDCAQSHLATVNNINTGNFGIAATFSFYHGKNIGALGDAGAIVTNDESLALTIRKFACHGGLIKGQHEMPGINSRMDSLHAAVLQLKLKYLPEWTEIRRKMANYYTNNLKDLDWVDLPVVNEGCNPSWHLYVIKVLARDGFRSYMSEKGISTAINYPIILPLVDAYAHLQHAPSEFEAAFSNQSRIVSLPLYPEMSTEQHDYVIETIRSFT